MTSEDTATQPVNRVRRLKEALLDELIDQFENGVKVVLVDEDGSKHIEVRSVDSKIMTVASKVVKDFAAEAEVDETNASKIEKLDRFLGQRGQLRVVSQ